MRLFIIGAGGHGKVVLEAAKAQSHWSDICFIDSAYRGSELLGVPVFSEAVAAQRHAADESEHVVAIGEARTRLDTLAALRGSGRRVATIVHPRAWVSPSAVLGGGTVVLAGAVICANSSLGAGCIVNTGATVDHDCNLGDGVHVCPGAHLAGGVTVGELTWIGVGAAVRNGIAIGAHVTLGVGAAVVANLPDAGTYAGVPARKLKGAARAPD